MYIVAKNMFSGTFGLCLVVILYLYKILPIFKYYLYYYLYFSSYIIHYFKL